MNIVSPLLTKILRNRFSILAIGGAFVFCTVFGIYSFSSTDRSAYKSTVPFYILKASKTDILSDAFVGALELTPDSKSVALFRRDNTSVDIIGHNRREKVPVGSGPVGAVSIGPNGKILIAKEGQLRILDSKGNTQGSFAIPSTTVSIAALGDKIVVSAPGDSLMTVYNASGTVHSRIGKLDTLDGDEMENRFLNGGTISINGHGEIYHVSIFSPNPKVQRFSADGNLLNEFFISGPAVELQMNREREFLATKSFACMGGYYVTRSASLDPSTNHLWVGMNGLREPKVIREESGTLYEYSADGKKLAEYALNIPAEDSSPKFLTDIQNIKVSFPNAYVLTSSGITYRFNLEQRQRVIPVGPQIHKGLLGYLFGSSKVLADEGPCGPALSPSYSCEQNCPANFTPVQADCDGELTSRLNQGEIVISGSCSVGIGSNGGCSGTITGCATNGVQVTYSTTIYCTAIP